MIFNFSDKKKQKTKNDKKTFKLKQYHFGRFQALSMLPSCRELNNFPTNRLELLRRPEARFVSLPSDDEKHECTTNKVGRQCLLHHGNISKCSKSNSQEFTSQSVADKYLLFSAGDVYPKGGIHSFNYLEQVYLIDESKEALVYDETKLYAWIVASDETKKRRKLKSKLKKFRP